MVLKQASRAIVHSFEIGHAIRRCPFQIRAKCDEDHDAKQQPKQRISPLFFHALHHSRLLGIEE
jgi:hypothetical protein